MSHPKSGRRRRLTAVVISLTLTVSALPASADSHPEVLTPVAPAIAKNSSGVVVDGVDIAGFDGGGQVFVSVSVPSGNLGATAQNATSVTDDGDLLRVSGSEADVSATLATLTYTPQADWAGDVNVTVTAFTSSSEPAYFSQTGHYYEFVTASLTWEQALTAASGRTLAGRQGYLATITSQEENDFVESKLQADGWMGGSDSDVEGEWRWADGPEAGVLFWLGGPSGAELTYANWANLEPNNAGTGENATQFYSSGNGWNDLPHTGHDLPGYVVEYGGMDGDTPSDVTAAFTITVYDVPLAPTDVSATSGNTTLEVSWTAPAGSEPVSGYRLTVSDDAGDNWVTAIEDTGSTTTTTTLTDVPNGVEHLVRVAALNDAGLGPWSASTSGTPSAPPLPPPPAEPSCEFDPTEGTTPEGSCWEEAGTDTPPDATADWQVEGTTFAVANGIIVPRPDGTIGADDLVNRRDVAEMLYRLAGSPAASDPHTFEDESDNPAVDWLASRGVVEGVGATSGDRFEPLRAVNRAEVLVLLWRMSGSPSVGIPHGFPDAVPTWAHQATSWATARGIAFGRTNGTLDAFGTATTAETLVMMHRWITATD